MNRWIRTAPARSRISCLASPITRCPGFERPATRQLNFPDRSVRSGANACVAENSHLLRAPAHKVRRFVAARRCESLSNGHATYSFSFVFLMGAALCEGIRFCSTSSGTRLIGPCSIGRARFFSRRMRRRDSSSNSSGPKTRKTIIASTNHALIVPHLSPRFAQKKTRKVWRGEVGFIRPAASGQVRGVPQSSIEV